MVTCRFSRFPVESVRHKGAATARTALRIDPGGADAHAVLGEIQFLYERDYAGSRAHLERAVEADAFAFHAAWLQSNLQELRDNFGGALAGVDSLRSMFPEYLPLSANVLPDCLSVIPPVATSPCSIGSACWEEEMTWRLNYPPAMSLLRFAV